VDYNFWVVTLITSIPELFLQPACCAWFVLSSCCLTCCLSSSYIWTNYWIDAVVYEPVCSVWTKYVSMLLCLCEIIEMHRVVIHELFGNIWKTISTRYYCNHFGNASGSHAEVVLKQKKHMSNHEAHNSDEIYVWQILKYHKKHRFAKLLQEGTFMFNFQDYLT
jgi:hypothetical protein